MTLATPKSIVKTNKVLSGSAHVFRCCVSICLLIELQAVRCSWLWMMLCFYLLQRTRTNNAADGLFCRLHWSQTLAQQRALGPPRCPEHPQWALSPLCGQECKIYVHTSENCSKIMQINTSNLKQSYNTDLGRACTTVSQSTPSSLAEVSCWAFKRISGFPSCSGTAETHSRG